MQTIKVKFTIDVKINIEDGVDIEEVLQDLDYAFVSYIDGAEVTEAKIIEQETY